MSSWLDQINYISYRSSNSLSSRQAGYSFGRLFYLSKPKMTEAQLWTIIRSLSISKAKIDVPAYAIGFYYGYASQVISHEAVTWLPEHPKKEELEKMGKIGQAVQKAREAFPQTPFVKMSTLGELSSVFCIKRIRQNTGQFGKQWHVTAMVDEGTQGVIETNPEGLVTITIPCSEDGQSQRDITLELLREDLPAHVGMFEAYSTGKGNPYYNLVEAADEICVCGTVLEETRDENVGDVFLDEEGYEQEVPLEQAGKMAKQAAMGRNGRDEQENASVPFTRKKVSTTHNAIAQRPGTIQSTQKGVDFSKRTVKK